MIKKITAKELKDSRGDKTICVILKTSYGKFITSAPSGKSKGKYEIKSYVKNLKGDINFINKLKADKINKIINKYVSLNKKKKFKKSAFRTTNLNKISVSQGFLILKDIEKLVKRKIGGNSLFCLEADLLKAFAKKNNHELWEYLLEKQKIKLPIPVGNAIGGGMHSRGVNEKKPDFQEFLFISYGKNFFESVKINNLAYKLAGKLLKARIRNDEGAWETKLSNEEVLIIMNKIKKKFKQKNIKINIGLDIASNSFYKNKKYIYKNKKRNLSKNQQINYIFKLIKKYKIFYVEDALNENDFIGFKKLLQKTNKKNALIVGDDLIVTNPFRLKKAIKTKSINSIIVKPNQIGSLIYVKQIIDICKKNQIKTIISHRSGETMDNTIADLGVGFKVNFIKTGIYGKVRTAKLKRLIKIENYKLKYR